jgi:phospholipid transport system substrate-binding protein
MAVTGLAVAAWVAVVVTGYQVIRFGEGLGTRLAAMTEQVPDSDAGRVSEIAPAAGVGFGHTAQGTVPATAITLEHIVLAGDEARMWNISSSEDGMQMASLSGPSAMVQRLGDDVITMLANSSLSEMQRNDAFRQLLVAAFDVDTISRIVLGRYWRVATPEQRDEYRRLFEDYIVATYARRFADYSGETMKVMGSRVTKQNVTVVRTRIHLTKGDPVQVDWLVSTRNGGDGRIIDVVVAGVSMALTHRSDFAAVIKRDGGIDGLLRQLREKIAGS